ncbi:YheC/YheD family endospore coat-associated protein [Metabacillus arenae]|uniref:YheC/YheD family protein n=1 Tax=Metabacillus arenae TaxID=2771434 RepID=A0A926NLQ4_9BACI|nr:YheC/YheD family protein [Metabacillus arenae]MBD1382903.1 YheC/YheD family protein [Metabacillus arenae]
MKNDESNPLIGICVSKDDYPGLLNLLTKRLQTALDHATFIRFHLTDIDFEKLKVKAAEYKKSSNEWQEGIFPMPDVVYMQCSANRETIKRIENIIGPKVFNSFLFDKWEGWKLLKKSWSLRKHLPTTQLLENNADLIDFISKFNYCDVIVKPINGYSSEGIYRIKFQEGKNIEISSTKGLKIEKQEFKYSKEFWYLLSPKFFAGTHIIQQSIETIKAHENVSDIRLNMNKNRNGQWEVSLLLFRIATNSSVVIPKSITAYNPDKFMKSSIYEKEKMGDIEKTIINLGLKICKAFDKSEYHMADLGIDLGMDEKGHLWIFEVNPLPFPTRGSVLDYSMTKPMEYALYLASKRNI